MAEHCSLCHLTVAPYARHNGRSDREVIGRHVVHRTCLVQRQMTAGEFARIAARKRFRERDLLFRHHRG